MPIPLLDLKRQYIAIKDKLDKAVLRVFEHGHFILGPEVAELEKKIAKTCGVKYGVGVASGTDALLLSLRAAGIGPGDEVITSDFSFFASAGVISRLGANPVFVDIDIDTYNLDPAQLERAITPKTRAIMPVYLFGQLMDMDPLMRVAQEHNLIVIEDAAQAIGATYKGCRAGSIGHLGCFSFYPSKNLGGAGDGGMVVTDSDNYHELLSILRVHGANPKYYHKIIGYNSRLSTLQAAVLLVKLDYLEDWTEKRRSHAKVYDAAFKGTAIKTPVAKDYSYHIYNQYTLAIENRDELVTALKEKNIGYDIYYPIPFHLQECFRSLGYRKGDFPVTEKISSMVISLPIYPELTVAEQEEVIETVKAVSA
ncbi:MAG: DegT/DnrJ/EryC1/StrS family aminotransferase [candidate division Zixibacteria bacterium]|nr:DegT/DnrJ/EryC1/StrS family aminotransferase [candidate division Zixibacteria bacterium]